MSSFDTPPEPKEVTIASIATEAFAWATLTIFSLDSTPIVNKAKSGSNCTDPNPITRMPRSFNVPPDVIPDATRAVEFRDRGGVVLFSSDIEEPDVSAFPSVGIWEGVELVAEHATLDSIAINKNIIVRLKRFM